MTKGEHFGKLSAKYKKILCIGSTGVENSHNGGFEQIAGDDADASEGNEFGLVEQTKTQSSLQLLSSSLISVKSITSAVAAKLEYFNTTLPLQCTDLAQKSVDFFNRLLLIF